MAVSNSSIEWTDSTWSPVTGCTKVSPGCDNCYAEGIANRFAGTKAFPNGFEVTLHPERLGQPLRWQKPRRVFVNSMSDLFHKDIPDEFIARVFAVMAATPQHTYQILTKRHGRMRSLLSNLEWRSSVFLGESVIDLHGPDRDLPTWPLPNVWLGVSVEDQKRADLRIPALLDTPASVRFLSCEPLLGPVDLYLSVDHSAHERDYIEGTPWPQCLDCSTEDTSVDWTVPSGPGIDWVIAGGESGRNARPMHPDWARSLRDQCQAAGVPYFFKQHGEWGPAPSNYGPDVPERARASTQLLFSRPGDVDGQIMLRAGKHRTGRLLDGRTWDEFPTP